MGEEAQARQKKAQRVLAEAFAQAEVTTSLEERAKLRANAKMEAELLINVCDYVQTDMVRSFTSQLFISPLMYVRQALKNCRFSSPWKLLIPSACQAEMTALANCRQKRYVFLWTRCAVGDSPQG